ncbi:MAG: oxygen-independent coproporphyrinogen III oxidase [Candidatus Viridilinea halotolerans]|uniref:Coproporphyrinogen-III oxidase n=1 Tax=Candidatus Viridilinea halotolerans TaxID=2491704 RepID=A0A426TXS2_9CHLR|nr:MAG: oxygen-independent coproporphyrinogen III oxidase [Candidatus Viridilinea halotolerans]
MTRVRVTPEQIDHYNKPGPRYTSYPTVPIWSHDFGEADYREALTSVAANPDDTLSLYVHLPFCAERCAYCGCNATVTRHEHVLDTYLDHVERELAMVAPLLGKRRRVVQLHWGGGTPNFGTEAQARRLMAMLDAAFDIDRNEELSLEMDPRIASREQAIFYRELGFNRVSLGVQDIDSRVQVAIGRIQPFEKTAELFNTCRDVGFSSVNIDLVYGLPYQSGEVFAQTLDAVINLRPDRVACFSYAHLPNSRANQKRVDTTGMPEPYAKFGLFQQSVESFTDAGYDWIGLDHFALSSDEMSQAVRERRLRRNFMGYTLLPASHMIALGMSSIGDLGGCFIQNDAGLGRYQKSLAAGKLPVVRGMRLTPDDHNRRAAIMHLMCNLELPKSMMKDAGMLDSYERVAAHAVDGLVGVEADRLFVTDLGRYFIRNLCMELDAHLSQTAGRPIFSKTV